MERRRVAVEVFDIGYGSETMPLADFVKQITDAYESIPEEHRADAVFEYEHASDDWGSSTVRAKYFRPETDAEIAEREADRRRRDERQDAYNRAMYERLRALYGDAPN